MDPGAESRNLEVPPAPVRDPRGGAPTAIIALAVLVAAIAAAIGIAQLVPPAPVPPRVSVAAVTPGPPSAPRASASGMAAASGSPSNPSPATTDGPPRLTVGDLAAAVRDGSLEGRLVFVEGVMRARRAACEGEPTDPLACVALEIPGVGLPVRSGEVTTPWPGEPPPDAWLVTVARAGGLVYLGSLVPSADGGRTIDGVVEGFGLRGRDWLDGTLFEVDGYLVVDPVHPCVRADAGATPCPAPPPVLAYDEPLADGLLVTDAGADVRLAGAVPGVDPADVVTAGTFLVTPGADEAAPWLVVARYEPARAVRVLVP